MPIFPDSVVKAANIAKDIAGLPNKAQRYLMELLDPQNKNLFEILLYPASFSLDPSSIAFAALDTLIARLHIQNITIPFWNITYERADNVKYVKDIESPDELSITFIENEEGFIRLYLTKWLEQVVDTSPLDLGAPFQTDFFGAIDYNFIFATDQNKSKKNAKIFLQMGSSLPSPSLIQIEGMKIKNMDAWEIGHDQEEPLRITCTFAVDMIYIKTLF